MTNINNPAHKCYKETIVLCMAEPNRAKMTQKWGEMDAHWTLRIDSKESN